VKLNELLPGELRTAIDAGTPLLVPSGCIEYHGPHLPLGVDTIIVEELCLRVAQRFGAIVAPALSYGPTGYAVSGPELGTVDVSTERFGRHVKDVLTSLWDVGFRWIVVCQHHQQLNGPEGLAIRLAAAEVTFERTRADRGDAWWGKGPLSAADTVFERIQVWPSVIAPADEIANMADHAGYYETALMLALRPELVALDRLGMDAPWYTNTGGSMARKATSESGVRMVEAMVDAWAAKLAELTRIRRLTPDDVTVKGLF
jgi:creatinine amidohydrolase